MIASVCICLYSILLFARFCGDVYVRGNPTGAVDDTH